MGLILALLMLASFALVIGAIVGIASGPLPPGPGVSAPLFSAKTVEGEAVSLLAQRGNLVLVDFWATWCPSCVAAMPGLQRVHRDFRASGLVVIGVNQEPGEIENVRSFVDRHHLTFPIVVDLGAIALDYGVFTIPTLFLIGPEGGILKVYRGSESESRLRLDIEEALPKPRGTEDRREPL